MDCRTCCSVDETKEVQVSVSSPAAPGFDFTPGEEYVKTQQPAVVGTMDMKPRETQVSEEPQPPMPEPLQMKEPVEPPPPVSEPIKETTSPATVPADPPPKKGALPDPKWREIDIPVNKLIGQDLGLDVDFGDSKTLKIVKLKPGVVSNWNQSKPTMAVEPGDRIVSVNGIGGSTDKIIRELQKGGEMLMKVVRAQELEIIMDKEYGDQPIGVDIDTNTVRVLSIKDGPVRDYNMKLNANLETFQLKPNDTIVEVNGVRGPPDVIAELKKSAHLAMIVHRPLSYSP